MLHSDSIGTAYASLDEAREGMRQEALLLLAMAPSQNCRVHRQRFRLRDEAGNVLFDLTVAEAAAESDAGRPWTETPAT